MKKTKKRIIIILICILIFSIPGKAQMPAVKDTSAKVPQVPVIPDSLIFLNHKELQESLSAFNSYLAKNMTYEQYTVLKVDLILATYWQWLKQQPVKASPANKKSK